MKKAMSLVLAALLVAALSGMPAAEPQSAKSTKSDPSEQTMEKVSPKFMSGKITQIDKDWQTFVIVSNGKQYRFSYGKAEWIYKVGQIVDVNYVVNPSGQMEATNLSLSKSSHY